MDIVYEQNQDYLAWAESRLLPERTLNVPWEPRQVRWVAGRDAGGVIWVVVFSHFCRRNCELTIATDGSKRWATKRSLRVIFNYPFRTLGLRRVTFIVRDDNHKSQGLVLRLGATFEGRIRRLYEDTVDGIVYGMTREECRWHG